METNKKNLTVREAVQYAQDNGFDKEMFKLNINGKYVASGKFLDAYYEFITIPIMGTGFLRFQDLCDEYGERNISVDIIEKEEFNAGVSFDFIIRGKFDSIPEEYKIAE